MRILLVDDEKGFLNILGDVLRDHGYDVVQAEDGGVARAIIDTQEFDLVISDVFMPTLNGSQFHHYVRSRAHAPEIPFIFLSGYDHDRARELVQNPRLDFFLSKTAPVEEIVACIQQSQTA